MFYSTVQVPVDAACIWYIVICIFDKGLYQNCVLCSIFFFGLIFSCNYKDAFIIVCIQYRRPWLIFKFFYFSNWSSHFFVLIFHSTFKIQVPVPEKQIYIYFKFLSWIHFEFALNTLFLSPIEHWLQHWKNIQIIILKRSPLSLYVNFKAIIMPKLKNKPAKNEKLCLEEISFVSLNKHRFICFLTFFSLVKQIEFIKNQFHHLEMELMLVMHKMWTMSLHYHFVSFRSGEKKLRGKK